MWSCRKKPAATAELSDGGAKFPDGDEGLKLGAKKVDSGSSGDGGEDSESSDSSPEKTVKRKPAASKAKGKATGKADAKKWFQEEHVLFCWHASSIQYV